MMDMNRDKQKCMQMKKPVPIFHATLDELIAAIKEKGIPEVRISASIKQERPRFFSCPSCRVGKGKEKDGDDNGVYASLHMSASKKGRIKSTIEFHSWHYTVYNGSEDEAPANLREILQGEEERIEASLGQAGFTLKGIELEEQRRKSLAKE